MVDIGSALRFYKQKKIQEALFSQAQDKEIVGSYGGKGYAKRPDILQYPGDVMALVKQGITSFHASEELWTNPLQLDPLLPKNEVEKLRKGWDLVLDIDCPQWKFSQYAAYYLLEALTFSGITAVSVKFSGNHGFHIGVPFEAFPSQVHGKDTKNLFPEAPRIIAQYLRALIKDHLKHKLLSLFSLADMAQRCNKAESACVVQGEFDPFTILDIDTILISPRHLYRMAYSFNEKSGLVSVPVDPKAMLDFTLNHAKAENVIVNKYRFLDRTFVHPDEARRLLVQAFDYKPIIQKQQDATKKYFSTVEELQEAIPELLFPHCIKKILEGLGDGKKRAMFILINFLRSAGWSKEQIEDRLYRWNKENNEPLREVYLKGQLRHAFHKKPILPPNCANQMYYQDLGLKCEDTVCLRSKNPVNAARRNVYFLQKDEKKGRPQLTEEQKEMRRKFREQKNA